MEKITFDGQIYNLTWHKTEVMPENKITQVSGYIFNEKNELLIVKVGKSWTIPGGKPENNETSIETLKREIIEEAGVTILEPKKIGHVEVLPEGSPESIHFQLRYVAYTNEIKSFKPEYEASERKFIKVDDVSDYIKWHSSEIFQYELNEAIESRQTLTKKQIRAKV